MVLEWETWSLKVEMEKSIQVSTSVLRQCPVTSVEDRGLHRNSPAMGTVEKTWRGSLVCNKCTAFRARALWAAQSIHGSGWLCLQPQGSRNMLSALGPSRTEVGEFLGLSCSLSTEGNHCRSRLSVALCRGKGCDSQLDGPGLAPP